MIASLLLGPRVLYIVSLVMESNLAIDGSRCANPEILGDRLDDAITQSAQGLMAQQQPDGHWVYELEADCTIPAEYILMNHFVDEVDDVTEQGLADYLRHHQNPDGGWSLYPDGKFDLSCSVKVYYALKLVGDDPESAHMIRAKDIILRHGGAAKANVFTRIVLVFFGQLPWNLIPFIPSEIIALPKWFPFHIHKVAYWSKTVMVPLSILYSKKAQAVNPKRIGIQELCLQDPKKEGFYLKDVSLLGYLFFVLDRIGRRLEPFIPKTLRDYTIRKCEHWCIERMNRTHGIGGIFPAMVNWFESLVILGYPKEHATRKIARQAIDALLVQGDSMRYCQPCLSPIWDTSLSVQATIGLGAKYKAKIDLALQWLEQRQIHGSEGDWNLAKPDLKGGGWAFQYQNDHYPDLDDTTMVAWAMHRFDKDRYKKSIQAATNWVAGMQSDNGGFGSFAVDNTYYYLNAIPFADHGALLDPPTADITARAVALLSIVDRERYQDIIQRAIAYLKDEQEKNGSWFGRWGTNYIYGTWSVLTGLELAGESPMQGYIQRAVHYLYQMQNQDGGWGESNHSYEADQQNQPYKSTSFQTAWAILGLLAAGQVRHDSVKKGISYLVNTQKEHGQWEDESYTAPGFPRVFYLKYHGYTKYFPLWALGHYRNLSHNFEKTWNHRSVTR